MKVTTVTYGGVKVIGHMASFAIIRFDAYENKQDFKRWLQKYGEEVKKESGLERMWIRTQGHGNGQLGR